MSNNLPTTEAKLLSISGVSQLLFEDEKLLRFALLKNPVHYPRSFLYILRASHGENGELGYKYVDQNLIAIIGHRNNCIYILPILDSTQGIALEKLCRKISSKTKCRILLKKFSVRNYPKLQQKFISKNQLTEEEQEDDSYPEKILKLKKLFNTPEGDVNSLASRFIKKIRRFEKQKIQLTIYNDLTHVSLEKIEQFLGNDNNKYVNYLPIILHIIKYRTDSRYRTTVFLQDKEIHGIYIAEIFSSAEVGLYCAVNSKIYSGSTEWMDWYFFRKIFFEDMQTIHLGGAENKGVDYYIKKLLPDNSGYLVGTVGYNPPLKHQELSSSKYE